MEVDLREAVPEGVYRTVTSVVVPRPIGWISTRTGEGGDNLAPYSFFNAVSARPPVVMFSAVQRDGRPKDTPTNALETGAFVYNLVTEDVLETMDATSEAHDPDRSEFDAAGIERTPSEVVDVPRVADAAVAFECELYDSLTVYDNTVVFGEVVYLHVDDALLSDGRIDSRKVDAVGRLGGPFYTAIDMLDFRRQY